MSSHDNHHIELPLDLLFSLLGTAGFDVSPATRLRAWRVLSSVGLKPSLNDPAELKKRLAPLFARSYEQQQLFYSVFDRYVEELKREQPPPPPPPPSGKYWRFIFLSLAVAVAAVLAYPRIRAWLTPQPDVIPEPSFFFDEDMYAPGDTVMCRTRALDGLRDSAQITVRWELLRAHAADTAMKVLAVADKSPEWRFAAPKAARDAQFYVRLTASYRDDRPDSSGVRLRTHTRKLSLSCPDAPVIPPLTVPAGPLNPGQSAVFALKSRPVAGLKYRWKLSGVDTGSDGLSFTHRFEEKGVFEVTLSITDNRQAGDQCSTDTSIFIRVGEEDVRLAYLPLDYDREHPGFSPGWLSWLILVVLLLLAGFFWHRWFIRKPTPISPGPSAGLMLTPGGDRPPYYIPFNQNKAVIRTAREQYRFADALRLRHSTDELLLDLSATLRATIDHGGFPVLRYRYRTRPSEYLFIVDEQMPGHHLTRLFRHLVETLRGQDVNLDLVWCGTDMRRFWGAGIPPGTSAEGLRRFFPAHRLVVLGNAHALLEPNAPRLRSDVKTALGGWPQRLLLTPQLPADWNWQEKLLYRHFGIFPSDLRGMLDATTFVENGLDADDLPAAFDDWKDTQTALRREVTATADRAWRTLEDHLDYLKPFGKSLTNWFLALAVHPSPAWEITLAIARKLEITPTYDRLLALARIPALRDGSLHPALRLKMLEQLDDELEKPAREAVLLELEEIKPLTEGSHVSEETGTYIVVQKFLLNPEDAENQANVILLLDSDAVSRGLEMELNRFVRKWTEEQSVMSKAGGFTPNIREWLNSRLPEPEPPKPVERPFDTPDLRKAVAFSAAALLWVLFLWQVCITGGWLHQLLTHDYLPFRNEPPTGLFLTVRQPDHLAKVYNNLGVLASQLAPRTDYTPRRDSLQAGATRLYGHLQDLSLSDSIRQSPWYRWLATPAADTALAADIAYPAVNQLLLSGYRIWGSGHGDSVAGIPDSSRHTPHPSVFILNPIKNTYNYAVTLLGQNTSKDTILLAAELFGDAAARAGNTYPAEALAARHGRGVAFFRAGMPDSARAVYNGLLETGYFDTLRLRPSLEELLGMGGVCYGTYTLGVVPFLRQRVTTAELESLTAKSATAPGDVLIAMLPPSTALTMLGTTNDGWQKVRLSGRSGYIPGYYAGRKTFSSCPHPSVKEYVVAVIAEIQRDMVQVKGGTFTMGCLDGRDNNCDSDEKPAYQVILSDYTIGKTEVTVAQFRAFIEETGYKTDADEEGWTYVWTGSDWIEKRGVNWKCDVNGRLRPEKDYNHPVIHVSWNDAAAFCVWLSGRTGIEYRLPTEAEWEFASRGGNASKVIWKDGKRYNIQKEFASRGGNASNDFLYAGSNDIDKVAWYRNNSGDKTHPVARKKSNELGLYDMSGNVWEWCGDWFGNYAETGKPVLNPRGPEGAVNRVLRGGSWSSYARYCRASNRLYREPSYRYFYLGFRIAASASR